MLGGVDESLALRRTALVASIAAAGLNLQNVAKSTVYLKDMADFQKMNAIYEAAFAPHKPARTTIQAAKLPRDCIVEIEVIAVVAD